MFKDKVFMDKLFVLGLPIALQNLLLASVAACDAFMLGRIDQASMAAVSLASQMQFVQNMIVTSAAVAESILGAQYWGKQDERSIQHVFFMTLRLAGMCSVLFFLGCILFPETLMRLFASDELLISIGVGYLKIAGWSYLLTGVSQCYLALFKITEHPKAAAGTSMVAVVLNILLNAVFIFGLFGCPAMGVKGAAIATLIARIVELVIAVGLSFARGYFKPDFSLFLGRPWILVKDFYRCAIPLIGAYIFWGVGFTSYTAFLGHMGVDAAAANSVAAVIRDLVCCMCHGAATAGGIILGNELGAGNLEKGRLYGKRLVAVSFLVGIVSALVMLLVIPASLGFVRLTPVAASYLKGMMLITALYMVGKAVNAITINGVFASGGDTMFDMYSIGVVMWGICIPLSALGVFVFHWPVLLVYSCTCLDEIAKVPWTLHHFSKYKWVKDLTR